MGETLVLANNTLVPGNFVPGYSGGYVGNLAYDPGQLQLFIPNGNGVYGNVSVVSTTTGHIVKTISAGFSPIGAIYDAGTGQVFVTDYNSATVAVISAATDSVTTNLHVGGEPYLGAYDSGRGELFIVNRATDNVSVISDSSDKIVATVAVGSIPWGAVYDAGRGEVFVANTASNNVSVISDGSNKVVATVDVGSGPVQLSYDSTLGEVFVTNANSDNVSVISDSSDRVVATLGEGLYPEGLAYVPYAGATLETNLGSDNLTVISDASDGVTSTARVGAYPFGIEALGNATSPVVYVTNQVSRTLSILTSTYRVTFTEFGLPTGTKWYANITGQPPLSSTGTTIVTNVSDGNYTYTIGSVLKNWAAPGGKFSVNGATAYLPVVFSRQTYALAFTESGIPAKTLSKHGWTVVLNGTLEHSVSTTMTFPGLPNGTYPVLITGPNGFDLTGSGTVTVHGDTTVGVVATKGTTVTLTFHEKKLTKGTNWCVTVDGYEECSTKATLKFVDLAPGTYSYAVASVAGYVATAKLGKTPEPLTGTLPLTKSATVTVMFAKSE